MSNLQPSSDSSEVLCKHFGIFYNQPIIPITSALFRESEVLRSRIWTEYRRHEVRCASFMRCWMILNPSLLHCFMDYRLKVFGRYHRCELSPHPLARHFWLFANNIVGKAEFNTTIIFKLDPLKVYDFIGVCWLHLRYFVKHSEALFIAADVLNGSLFSNIWGQMWVWHWVLLSVFGFRGCRYGFISSHKLSSISLNVIHKIMVWNSYIVFG